ncbi:hypothetical protein [Paracidovorax valerianellae]|nr:hypothetical protein [Paracidovorax valerianellae]MDA8447321.1 hypothetical protein [Paracidovorax valerianellae]
MGLLFVVALQAYYEVGQNTAAKYAQEQKTVIAEQERENELNKRRDEVGDGKGAEVELQKINQELAKSIRIQDEATEQTRTRLHWMSAMLFWSKGLQAVDDTPPSETEKAQYILGILDGWLTLLRNFLLPIAWGFLGAALYVSRALADDIRAMAYASERAVLHGSRYYMGMVAGFVAAKFFPTSVGVELGEVAPFAVALLVGYSVEVLFSMLDRLIAAFSTK